MVKTGLSAFFSNRNRLRMAASDSLISFTEPARVEPIVLIDQSVMHYDSLGDVQQSLLALFSGYYLQAAALTNSLGAIAVMDRLDPLNPTRNPKNNIMMGNSWLFPVSESHQEKNSQAVDPSAWMLSQEAYTYGLPFAARNSSNHMAIESNNGLWNSVKDLPPAPPEKKYDNRRPNVPPSGNNNTLWNARQEQEQSENQTESGANVGGFSDVTRDLTELANLSVGKTYSIELVEGKNKVNMPVSIRLLASAMPTKDLIHILSTGSQDNSWKERWHGFRSGRLAFWKDLVLCCDIVDQYRRDILSDKTGTLARVNKIQRSNELATIISGNPTVASASNLVVISQETADELEMQLEGRLSDFKIRQRMMKSTYLMILAVIDNDYGRVTFYHRGIPVATQVRLRDLKGSNKGNGPDVSDILKAYQLGNSPTL